MKNILSILAISFFVNTIIAQSVPQKINYQAVAHDANGDVLANKNLNVTVGILSGSAVGTLVYEETHSVTSNQYGLFYFKIGEGVVSSGAMNTITWETTDHFVNVNVNGDDLGTTQLVSVPYALASGSASGINGVTISNGVVNAGDVLVFNGTSGQWEAQAPTTGGTNGNNSIITAVTENPGANCPTGGSFIEYGTDDDNSGVLDAGEVDGSYFVCNGVDGLDGASLVWLGTLATAPATPNLNEAYYNSATLQSQVWDGTAWQIVAIDGTDGIDGLDGLDGTSLVWLGTLATAPATPNLNEAYYNSTTLQSQVWDGTAWQTIAIDGTNGSDGIDGLDGLDGTSLVWLGSLATAPATPNLNEAYYNSTTLQSQVWDGTAWQTIAVDGLAGANGTNGVDGIDGVSMVWLGSLGTAPGSPNLNEAYYNTATMQSQIWDGTAWQTVAVDGLAGANGTNGVDGISMVWLGSFATAPGTPNLNEAYYNTTSLQSQVWDGTNWQTIAVDGLTGASGAAGADGLDGTSIVWLGSLSGAPTTPNTNEAYYNTATMQSQIWDGTAWQILAIDGASGTVLSAGSSIGDVLVWDGTNWVAGVDNVDDADADPNNEIQDLGFTANGDSLLINNGSGVQLSSVPPTAGQVLTWNGINWEATNANTGTDIQSISFTANGDSLLIDNGAGVQLSAVPPSSDQALVWNGIQWGATDIDNDNFNELQSISFTANGDSLLINNGAGVQLSAVPPSVGQVLTWNGINWEATNANTGTDIQSISFTANGDSLLIDNGAGVQLSAVPPSSDQALVWNGIQWGATDIDNDNFNELQSISFTANGDSLLINNGAGVQLSAVPPSAGQVLTWNGINWEATNANTGTDIQSISFTANGDSLLIDNGAGVQLSAVPPSSDQALVWNGIQWGATDIDNDNFNELQSISFTANGDSLLINNGAGVQLSAVPPSAGQVLTWNGINWEATNASSNNIYTNDGTLTGARTVTIGANTLDFNTTAVSGFNINSNTFNVNGTNGFVGIGVSPTVGKFSVEHNSTTSNPVVNISNPTSSLNRMHFRNGPTSSKFWEIGAATKATDASSGWTVSYDDGAGNYNYHLAVYGDGKVAVGDSINNSNSSIFDVFGSTTLHDTLSIRTIYGSGYSFPVKDGTANYVMQTDGAGAVTWVDPTTIGATALWSDGGATTYRTDLTDSIAIGTAVANEMLHVEGNSWFNGVVNVQGNITSTVGGVGITIQPKSLASGAISGSLNLLSGANTNGGSGNIVVQAPDATGGGGIGGNVTLVGGGSRGTSKGGNLNLNAGFGGGSGGVGGDVNITSGGAGGTGGRPGDIIIASGATSSGGAGNVSLSASNAGTGGGGDGGALTFSSGNGLGNPNKNGGDVSFNIGEANAGVGTDGSFIVKAKTGTEYFRYDGTNNRFGIGTATPSNKLEVVGDAAKFDSVIIVNGAAAGYVLQSADALGNAQWVDPSVLGSSLWTDAGTATYLTDLTDSVGIGTVSPFAKFHVLTDGGANQVVSHAISNTTDDAGTIALLRAKGSLGSETAVQNGDRIGQIVFNGYNSSSTIYEEAAYISVSAEENYTSIGAGSRMEFHTAQIGGSTTEAMVITSGQNVGIGVATPAQKLSVEATSGNVSAVQGVNNQTGTGSDSHGLFGSTANDYFGSAGVKGEASGADGMGMFGVASTGSASGYGVFGDYKGTGGGTGVAGRIDNASASASSIGVHGINFSQGPGVASFVKNGTSGEKTSMLVEATATAPAPGMGSRIDFATGTTFNSTEVIASITATSTNVNQGSSEGDLSFSTVQGGGTIRTKRMTILSGGNVGIGTTTPSNKLEVIGDAAKFDSVIIVNGANAGYVLTSDASGNASWAESSSNNVVISLTNRTGIASNKGDVIVADPANPNSFIFTNSPGNATVLGVVYESGVANLGACKVAISGVVEVNVSATPILGQHCVTSLSNGQAASVSTPGAGTSIGVWIDATPGAEKVLLR